MLGWAVIFTDMTALSIFSNTISFEFESKSFKDFELKHKELCKIAGGGINNEFIRKGANKFIITFYYPSEKSLNSARIRFETTQKTFPIKEVLNGK